MLSNFRTLVARPGAREAARNLGWLVAERAARLVLNVGVGFWVARYLGPAQFGTLAYALAIVGLLSLLGELGLDAVVRRELIREPGRAPALLATVWRLRLAGGAIAYACLLGGVAFGKIGATERSLLAVLGLTLFQPALWVADLGFQARLWSRFSVWAQVGGLGVGAALRVALIVAGAPLAGFAWAVVVETAAAAAGLAWLARREGLAVRWTGFDAALARRLVREAWPLLCSGLTIVVYMRVDTLMLRAMVGEAEVGIYAAATRFTEIWYFVPVALASSVLPALLRARERGAADYAARCQACYDVYAGVAYLFAVPLALLASRVVAVAYGPAYAAAGPVLAVHVWSGVFVFLGVARGQFLVNEGYTRFYLAATLAGLGVNVTLNLLLIPRHGAWGAALATLAGQAVAAWLSSFCFAPIRPTAWMQLRALFVPVRWHRYVRRT